MLELLFTGKMLFVTLFIFGCAALLCVAAKYTERKTPPQKRPVPRKTQFRRMPAAQPLVILASDSLRRRARFAGYRLESLAAYRRRRHIKR